MLKNALDRNHILESLKNDFFALFDKDEAKTGYSLNFVGKDYAKLKYGLATETVLKPDAEHNDKPENKASENVFITGDNLEVLKHLQNAYSNKIKMIYIDPPYNTGKEFVYSDKFEFDDEKLRNALGYTPEEVERLKSLQGKSSHSAWLTFMYPRLKIAQKLLSDDGVIFISIDDNEQANLKLLCDDIFGEGNFVADFIVIRSEGGGLAKQAVIGHDYLLVYARNISHFKPLGKPKDIRGKIVTINNEDYWIETDWLREEFGRYGTCLYEDIVKWHGQEKREEIDIGIKNGIYTLIKKDKGHIVGRYRKISEDTSKFYTILKHLNRNGNNDLELLGLNNYFDFPKPVSLLKEVILGATIHDKSALILDFFAGSGTTAHAVLDLNKEDGGNRKFIMVQLDEPTNETSEAKKAGYKTIDEISRERIKRAGGNFKHFYCQIPPIETIDKIEKFDPSKPVPYELFDNMVNAFGEETILQTWLIADGYEFNQIPETKNFSGYNAHYIDGSLYIINEGWGGEQTKELLNLAGTNKLLLNHIRIYGYSIGMESLRELKINVSQSLERVEIELRY